MDAYDKEISSVYALGCMKIARKRKDTAEILDLVETAKVRVVARGDQEADPGSKEELYAPVGELT